MQLSSSPTSGQNINLLLFHADGVPYGSCRGKSGSHDSSGWLPGAAGTLDDGSADWTRRFVRLEHESTAVIFGTDRVTAYPLHLLQPSLNHDHRDQHSLQSHEYDCWLNRARFAYFRRKNWMVDDAATALIEVGSQDRKTSGKSGSNCELYCGDVSASVRNDNDSRRSNTSKTISSCECGCTKCDSTIADGSVGGMARAGTKMVESLTQDAISVPVLASVSSSKSTKMENSITSDEAGESHVLRPSNPATSAYGATIAVTAKEDNVLAHRRLDNALRAPFGSLLAHDRGLSRRVARALDIVGSRASAAVVAPVGGGGYINGLRPQMMNAFANRNWTRLAMRDIDMNYRIAAHNSTSAATVTGTDFDNLFHRTTRNGILTAEILRNDRFGGSVDGNMDFNPFFLDDASIAAGRGGSYVDGFRQDLNGVLTAISELGGGVDDGRMIREAYFNTEYLSRPTFQVHASALIRIATYCPRLKILSLSGCDIKTDTLIKETGEWLSMLAYTPQTYLTRELVTPAQALSQVLERCAGLLSLDLAGCAWVSEETVLDVVNNAKNLCALNLLGCSSIKHSAQKLFFVRQSWELRPLVLSHML
jgi:hypothetical protein